MQKNYIAPINMVEATKRWGQIVEKLGVTDSSKKELMVEYAQMHADSIQSGMIKENAGVGYSNIANTSGMGAVVQPGLSGIPGLPGTAGSGDLAQSLLPGALKIWAQTPGLDLVNTINVNSNKVSLLYFDWKFDDASGFDNDERVTTFKIDMTGTYGDVDLTALKAFLRKEVAANGITELRGRLSKSLYFHLSAAGTSVVTPNNPLVKPTGALTGWVEFVGFGRIDDLPMFRAYIQANTASAGAWTYSASLNTFAATGTLATILAGFQIDETTTSVAYSNTNYTIGEGQLFCTQSPSGTTIKPVLASLAEEFVDGFVTGRQRTSMTRGTWDATYADKIGPDSSVKDVEIGVAHVKASLRLSELDDYKKMYGVNIIERTKAQLVNLMSQQISIEITDKIKELGEKHRAKTALAASQTSGNWGSLAGDARIHDFSVPMISAALGGEHNASIARKLNAKMTQASYFIANEGRIAGADFAIVSSTGAGMFKSIERYQINPADIKMAGPGNLQPAGTVDGVKIYVDPFMAPGDLTVYLGRKTGKEEPGIAFLAYVLAQNVEIVSEATMGHTMYMYSRYAVAELGWFPEKQYLAMKVYDPSQILS